MTRPYLYAIIPSDDQLVFEVEGIEAGEVMTFNREGLAVVASPVQRASFNGLDRTEVVGYLSTHQRVVEAVLREFPVLPVKFGTTLADQRQVETLLSAGAQQLRDGLAQITGRSQYEVVALWELQAVFAELSATPEVAAVRAQVAALPPEQQETGRVLLGRLVHGLLLQRREALCTQIEQHLRAYVEDIVRNPLMDDQMVANLALLISDEQLAAFDEGLSALDTALGGALQFRLVGPLAPYSFATLVIETPDAAAVEAARLLIELPEQTSLAELKQRFRRLAALHHPDRNPDDAGAQERMDELNKAYQLLSSLAEAQARTNDQVSCRLDPDAVAQTLLLRIERQEAA